MFRGSVCEIKGCQRWECGASKAQYFGAWLLLKSHNTALLTAGLCWGNGGLGLSEHQHGRSPFGLRISACVSFANGITLAKSRWDGAN